MFLQDSVDSEFGTQLSCSYQMVVMGFAIFHGSAFTVNHYLVCKAHQSNIGL